MGEVAGEVIEMKLVSSRIQEFLNSGVSYPLAREYDLQLPGAINLASNESPYGPSPRVSQTLRKELKSVGRYPDPRAVRLRRAIGEYLGIRDENVVIGNGSDELMDLICKAFLDLGDRVFIPTPSFSMYELACRANGGVPKFHQLSNFRWNPSELARAGSGAKIVFLGRPNNPTGNAPSKRCLTELAGIAELMVVDEAYVEFDDGSVARWAVRRDNVIVLRTFSKAFGLAGLRIGYAVGAPELIGVLERLRAPFNVNRIAQAAALAALADVDYVKRVVQKVKRERERLYRGLLKFGLEVIPSRANFLMANVRSGLGLSAPQFCDELAKRRIFVRDLSSFRGAGLDWVRISVGKPVENEKLLNAIEGIKGGV
jgi:histidinol-phosphate aminotransferase